MWEIDSGDKERMRTMITWLGFRHVKYGVRPHHIPIMGQVREKASDGKQLGKEMNEARPWRGAFL